MTFFTDNPALFAVHQQTHAPGTLPDGTEPTMFSDFKNGVYTVEGVVTPVEDIWTEDTDFGNFDPATHIVPGTGLGPNVTNPVFAPAIAAPALAGCTIVMTCNMGAPTGRYVQIDRVDAPDFNNEQIARLIHSGSGLVQGSLFDYNDGENYVLNGAPGRHRIAATLANEGMAMSVNGGAVITYDPGDIVATVIAVQVQGGQVVEDVGLYPIQDNAELPALSTL